VFLEAREGRLMALNGLSHSLLRLAIL